MIIKISTCLLPYYFVLFISACSSSDQSTTVEPSVDGVLISGGSCSEIDLFLEENGPSLDLDSSTEFFVCDGVPNTNINAEGLSGTGDGVIRLMALDIPIETAAVEVFPETAFANHKGIQLYLHDGELRIEERRYQSSDSAEMLSRHKIDWGIYNGSFVLSVELGSASVGNFESGVFEYVGIEDPDSMNHVGMNTIFYGTIFYDNNRSGTIDATDEIVQVIGGNISIVGNRPNWSISIDVQLDNGENMSGYFNGDYIDIPLADANQL